MKALVLAAGKGSRLGRAAGGLPKPLVEVGGRTPLAQVLGWVSALRPSCIWINLHEQAALVRNRTGDSINGVPIAYSYEPQLLGTAGAWKKLEAEWEDTSLVVYGDNLIHFDLKALLVRHRKAGRAATLALFDPARHANTGTAGGHAVVLADRVVSFEEGGDNGAINAGVYALEPRVRALVAPGFRDFGHDVLPRLAASGALTAHIVEDTAYCLGVDTPERLAAARKLVRALEAP